MWFAIAEEIAACEGKVLQIAENSSSTLFAVYDGLSVTIFDTKNHSQMDKFIDEKIARINFYTEGENEFLAAITETGQFVVRKLIKTEEGVGIEDGEPYYSADCSDVSGRKALIAVAFSDNSDYVAAAFDDNSVQVHFRLRVTGGSISHTITSHKTPVYGIEFSKTGEYLATVSTDGEAYVWNSYTTSRITRLKGIYA